MRDSFETAQGFFNGHATQGCEVVLESVGSMEYPSTGESTAEGTEDTDSQSTVD